MFTMTNDTGVTFIKYFVNFSVSTQRPVWSNQDMSIQYRPAEWLSHEEFALPKTSLCLLIPIRGTNIANSEHKSDSLIGKLYKFKT